MSVNLRLSNAAYDLQQGLCESPWVASDLSLTKGERVAAMVNSMGATPAIELAVMTSDLADLIDGAELILEKVMMGEFMTSLDMAGASLTLLRLDGNRASRLAAPCDTPYLRTLAH